MEMNADNIPAYPECILPQPSYRDVIIEAELWSSINGLVIQRGCPETIDHISPESFGNNLSEMSVNLLGGIFIPEFVKFTPKGVRSLPTDVIFDKENYNYSPKACGIYLSVCDIHDRCFPSSRKFPDHQEYDKVKGAVKSDKERLLAAFNKRRGFSKDIEYVVEYRISVMHRPTNANYWHCQIEIAPACEGGKIVSKDKADWQKNALRALTNLLVIYASINHPDPIPFVKEEWYICKPA